MKRSIKRVALLIGCLTFLLTGCLSNSKVGVQGDEDKITVYASFYTMYDFAKKIGGDRINLTNVMPEGTEPHHWEPSPRDMLQIEKADVFVYNGAGMEPWVEKVLGSINNKSLVVVETSRNIELLQGSHSHDEDHEEENPEDEHHSHDDLEYDPHVWLSPKNAKKQMEAIKDAFIKADPANSEYYEMNFNDNAEKLDILDREYREELSKCTKKDIVVGHQAFGYLCEEYGLKQNAIEGLNADSEPTPARMAEIVKFIKEKDVKVIFSEKLLSQKVPKAIASETGAKVEFLNPLGGLAKEDIDAGKEYFSIMRENLEALKKALE
ncbi:metal ABC transporter substrate-binding protein [Acetivibrio mesophilus]|uniref:ABC transporter substrate-binding protein n=1 Tax=Acetivibrio mesophilus TaxID=2487273 RepID=A0A4Q0I874_9FIRM|nr:metal ABC transporter substrate-binding protein [Acetivibrio mesophilus]ODM25623.1 ABC transporter substrate-binding protein [Clostridium sp. Bc-iso-3]RXE60207.1 ABC transporter substrate-binding protein [Acetivibrio mesophilus]HHV29028.1 zinc ABC transporter substrate-binding protein [Clostridium sp.]